MSSKPVAASGTLDDTENHVFSAIVYQGPQTREAVICGSPQACTLAYRQLRVLRFLCLCFLAGKERLHLRPLDFPPGGELLLCRVIRTDLARASNFILVFVFIRFGRRLVFLDLVLSFCRDWKMLVSE
jgi:hypothetical protein